jgi:dihydrofolate reductase
MTLSLIAAMDRNRGIGFNGDIPWFINGKSTIEGDMARFRTFTMGRPVIMGRNTYFSMGKALPGRTNIVLTYEVGFTLPDAIVVHSFEEAIKAATESPGGGQIFVIGGGKVFAEALPKADRMYLTTIDADFPADAYFPEYNMNEWNIIDKDRYVSINNKIPAVRFIDLERKSVRKVSSQK